MTDKLDSNHNETSIKRSINQHLMLGLALIVFVAGGVSVWAATTKIAGAVIATGTVVVESNTKNIQHPSGGLVREILVRNGDNVKAGDPLFRLDSKLAETSLMIINKRLAELGARRARLAAERDGLAKMSISPGLEANIPKADFDRIVTAEQRLFDLRSKARTGQKAQMRERIAQLKSEIRGMSAQTKAVEQEISLIQRELKSARKLWARRLMSITKITALEREAVRLVGRRAKLTTTTAATKGRIAETELKIIQIDRNLASEVAKELREIDARTGEFVERKVASEHELKRFLTKSPLGGTIHQSTLHTVGGVIAAGETVMRIVPSSSDLTVEAKVAPQDIDQLQIGQQAILRFSAFSQGTTPQFTGRLSSVSADTTTDKRTGAVYYTIRVTISSQEVAQNQITLVPGMPVEVFVKSAERNVISYLVKPLSDQAMRTFREQ